MGLSSLLTWFYCLDYNEILCLVMFGSLLYVKILPRYIPHHVRKGFSICLLICWIAVILVSTLYTREASVHSPSVVPLHSYFEAVKTGNKEIYRSNLMNVILFFPIGLLQECCFSSRKSAVITAAVLALVLSVGIECSQYWLHLGRPEADDVLHNVLGALLGAAAPFLADRIWVRTDKKGSQ